MVGGSDYIGLVPIRGPFAIDDELVENLAVPGHGSFTGEPTLNAREVQGGTEMSTPPSSAREIKHGRRYTVHHDGGTVNPIKRSKCEYNVSSTSEVRPRAVRTSDVLE